MIAMKNKILKKLWFKNNKDIINKKCFKQKKN